MTLSDHVASVAGDSQAVDVATEPQNHAPDLSTPDRLQAPRSRWSRGDRSYYSKIGKLGRSRPRASKAALKQAHGALQRLRTVDRLSGRSAEGKAVHAFKEGLIAALGGQSNVGEQQMAVIEVASATWLLLQIVDRDLMAMDSLMNRGKRCLWPVVLQRQVLADALVRYLDVLGLERRARPVETLDDLRRRINSSTPAAVPVGTSVPAGPVPPPVADEVAS